MKYGILSFSQMNTKHIPCQITETDIRKSSVCGGVHTANRYIIFGHIFDTLEPDLSALCGIGGIKYSRNCVRRTNLNRLRFYLLLTDLSYAAQREATQTLFFPAFMPHHIVRSCYLVNIIRCSWFLPTNIVCNLRAWRTTYGVPSDVPNDIDN